MTQLQWDQVGQRFYETGVDHGVLYKPNPSSGLYDQGYAWNGLTSVTESPSGAEATPQYADNIKYLNLYSYEEFGGTIEAFTYPDEWLEHDGTAELEPGVTAGQQDRKPFGMSYRTRLGNDLEGNGYGYKLHLVYGATASPSEKAYATVNDSPEAVAFSWEFSTVPVAVTGFKPTAILVINSTKVDPAALADLEDALYGTVGSDPMLPLPDAVRAFFSGTVTTVVPTAPTYNSTTDVVTIPTITGVEYRMDGEVVTGTVTITESKVFTANPLPGYRFPDVSDNDWLITFA